jgi:hypothetical protein
LVNQEDGFYCCVEEVVFGLLLNKSPIWVCSKLSATTMSTITTRGMYKLTL